MLYNHLDSFFLFLSESLGKQRAAPLPNLRFLLPNSVKLLGARSFVPSTTPRATAISFNDSSRFRIVAAVRYATPARSAICRIGRAKVSLPSSDAISVNATYTERADAMLLSKTSAMVLIPAFDCHANGLSRWICLCWISSLACIASLLFRRVRFAVERDEFLFAHSLPQKAVQFCARNKNVPQRMIWFDESALNQTTQRNGRNAAKICGSIF